MSELSKIVDKATNAIVNGQTLSTDNLNDLAKIFYASANRIIEAIDKSAGLHREIVQQLPTQDIDDITIYMVLDSSASGSDIYDEWMWIENAWEHIGSTRVDLSDYYNKTQVDTALSGKANVATSIAGYGITDAYTKTEVDTGLSGKANTSDIPTTLAGLSEDSTHRIVTDTEKSTWNGKQGALTFDNVPTQNSNNPVKSGGVKTYVDGAVSYKAGDVITNTNFIAAAFGFNTSDCYFTMPLSKPVEARSVSISNVNCTVYYGTNQKENILGATCTGSIEKGSIMIKMTNANTFTQNGRYVVDFYGTFTFS